MSTPQVLQVRLTVLSYRFLDLLLKLFRIVLFAHRLKELTSGGSISSASMHVHIHVDLANVLQALLSECSHPSTGH